MFWRSSHLRASSAGRSRLLEVGVEGMQKSMAAMAAAL